MPFLIHFFLKCQYQKYRFPLHPWGRGHINMYPIHWTWLCTSNVSIFGPSEEETQHSYRLTSNSPSEAVSSDYDWGIQSSMCLSIDFSGIWTVREERGLLGYLTLTHVLIFSVWIAETLMAHETISLTPLMSSMQILSMYIHLSIQSTQEAKENSFSLSPVLAHQA